MSVAQVRAQHAHEQEVSSMSRLQPPSLPTWESFPHADRQRLVRTILSVAQQHRVTVQGCEAQELGR